MPDLFKKGDAILITADGRTVPGIIALASPNNVSLALQFEALLHGFAGFMPVLLGADGVYRTLIGQYPVKIEPRPTGRLQ